MTRLLRCLQSVVANILQGADLVSLGTCAGERSRPLELRGHHLDVTRRYPTYSSMNARVMGALTQGGGSISA